MCNQLIDKNSIKLQHERAHWKSSDTYTNLGAAEIPIKGATSGISVKRLAY